MPHKFNAARRHKFPKKRYRVTNWAEYTPSALALFNGIARGGRLRLHPDDGGRLACPNPLGQNLKWREKRPASVVQMS